MWYRHATETSIGEDSPIARRAASSPSARTRAGDEVEDCADAHCVDACRCVVDRRLSARESRCAAAALSPARRLDRGGARTVQSDLQHSASTPNSRGLAPKERLIFSFTVLRKGYFGGMIRAKGIFIKKINSLSLF